MANALERPGVRLIEGDVLDMAVLEEALEGCDWVFHLQANADVRRGLEHPRRDLEQNTIATSNVLEAMRLQGVGRIVFSSTGSVYGEPEVFPTAEDAPFPVQTSLYGASKLAGEGLISAYVHGYGFTGLVFRFVSILGERYTHGHVLTSTAPSSATRPGCVCWAMGARRSPTCTSRTVSTRSSPPRSAIGRSRPRSTSTTSAPTKRSWSTTQFAFSTHTSG